MGISGLALGLSIQSAHAMSIQVAEAPTTDLALTISAIQGAQKSLLVNIYDLSSPEIANALVERIHAGVQVNILEEGQPVGGISSAGKGIQGEIVSAMQSAGGGNHLYEMTSKAGGKRRFHYDHAKYVVIDDERLLIGSENYSPTGNPEPGTLGNRGWEILINDSAITQQFKATFQGDANSSAGDVLDLTRQGGATVETRISSSVRPAVANPGPAGTQVSADSVEQVMSPETSLSGLESMITGARTSIDIEQMTFDSAWKSTGTNPLVTDLIAAARRGVHVRVLLNDESVFDHAGSTSKPKNQPTVDTLSSAGIEAKIANLKAMGVDYIHNKGMLADGNKTLISSINWDENAISNNREAAVIVSGSEVYDHYEALFESDWQAGGGSVEASAKVTLPKTTPVAPSVSGVANPPASDASIDCPETLSLVVKVGDIKNTDQIDKSFRELAGKTIKDSFSQVKSVAPAKGSCVLRNVSGSRFVELSKSSGKENLTLEGYTSAEKLYSVRAPLDAESDDTRLDAKVYDNSGGRRILIGSALVDLSF